MVLGYTARSKKENSYDHPDLKDLLHLQNLVFFANTKNIAMSKFTLFAITLIVIVLTGTATIYLNSRQPKGVPKSEVDTAINQAKFLYSQRKAMHEDFSSGPCLSNALMPDWVVDIVHNPRLPIDDLPENQCPAYIQGKAHHFVELDTEGNLVRAR